jgi:putative ABC transport system permease protein
MNLVALKMLMGDKLKYLSLIAGLALAAFLIVQQASILQGLPCRWERGFAIHPREICG